MKIYDGHSHLGNDAFVSLVGDLQRYFSLAETGNIVRANIMPMACPEYRVGNTKRQSLVWEDSGNPLRYFAKTISGSGETSKYENPPNPYREYNDIIKKVLEKEVGNVDLRFVPLLHPTLDKIDYLEKVLDESPVAVKVHGLACGIVPSQIPTDFLRRIGKKGIPVIVHRDYAPPNFEGAFNHLRRENTALNWLRLFEKYSIPGYITHGANLCPESFDVINNSGQHVLAIGPDLLMEDEPECLLQKGPYLSNIFDQVRTDRIVFDVDYPFNVKSLEGMEEDTDPFSRNKYGSLSQNEKERLFFKNAEKFFSR